MAARVHLSATLLYRNCSTSFSLSFSRPLLHSLSLSLSLSLSILVLLRLPSTGHLESFHSPIRTDSSIIRFFGTVVGKFPTLRSTTLLTIIMHIAHIEDIANFFERRDVKHLRPRLEGASY